MVGQGSLIGWLAPTQRRAQALHWSALVLLVLLAHAWALVLGWPALSQQVGRLPAARPQALQVRLVAPVKNPAMAPAATPAVTLDRAPAHATRPQPGADRAAAPLAAAAPATAPPADTGGRDAGVQALPQALAAAAADKDLAAADGQGLATWGNAARAEPGTAPPLYPTTLPPGTTLRYQARYLGKPAVAVLQWQAADGQYQLRLDTQTPGGEPLLSQTSQGQVDAHGVAPERFVDRRRGRSGRAANLQPQAGRVSFSASPLVHPAFPGTQDRLSWLVQLAAIEAGAAPAGSALDQVRLHMVDGRGWADTWVFERQADATVDSPHGPVAVRHWRRDPPYPDGLRAEAWLARPDALPTLAAAGVEVPAFWPVRLRYTLLRTGATIELGLWAAGAGP